MATLFGDWNAVTKWMANAASKVAELAFTLDSEVLEEAAVEARAEILANQVMPPSQKSTGQAPKDGSAPYSYPANVGSQTTLVDTGTYADAIGVYSAGKTKYVGLPPTGTHSPSGLSWDTLYKILRFGTARMPPRPHIDGAAQRVFGKWRKKLKTMGFIVDGK